MPPRAPGENRIRICSFLLVAVATSRITLRDRHSAQRVNPLGTKGFAPVSYVTLGTPSARAANLPETRSRAGHSTYNALLRRKGRHPVDR